MKLLAYHFFDKTKANPKIAAQAGEANPDSKVAEPKSDKKAADPKLDAKAAESKPDVKPTEPKPDANTVVSQTDTKSSDLTPQIAKRAYELYEAGGRQKDHAVQDWEQANREIQKDSPKSDTKVAEPKPDAKVAQDQPNAKAADTQPEVKATEPKTDIKTADSEPNTKTTEPKSAAKSKTLTDLTPQLVKRVHELYEQLGREEVRAVEELESAQKASQKDEK